MKTIIGKWVVHKRLPEEGNSDRPWGVYTSKGLEMFIYRTWSEAMVVATTLTGMTTYVQYKCCIDPEYDAESGYIPGASAKLRIYHEHEKTSWVINENVVRGNEEV